MKYHIYIFLLFCQFIAAQSGFEKGNDFYRKENYEAAVAEYESVLKSKKHSAELYFNLGNSYYKLNRVAPAIYNYEKALLIDPEDEEVRNNLKFAQKMMIDEVMETPRVGFKKMIGDFTSTFHYDTWAWLSIGFAVLFVVFFIGYYFSAVTSYKRIFFIGMFVIAFLVILCIIGAALEKSRSASERPAIVFSGIASVRSEPKAAAGETTILHEGTKVYVIEALDGFKKIELQDGTDGWIEAAAIKELKQDFQ